MDTVIIPERPTDVDQYEEVSNNAPEWETKFLSLIHQKKRIKYGRYTMPVIPQNIKDELTENGYRDLIVKGDHWQHFLLPD